MHGRRSWLDTGGRTPKLFNEGGPNIFGLLEIFTIYLEPFLPAILKVRLLRKLKDPSNFSLTICATDFIWRALKIRVIRSKVLLFYWCIISPTHARVWELIIYNTIFKLNFHFLNKGEQNLISCNKRFSVLINEVKNEHNLIKTSTVYRDTYTHKTQNLLY